MNGILLYGRMAARRTMACLLVILFVAAATIFLLIYPNFITHAREQLDYAYDTAEVTGWIINTEGYGEPTLSRDAWHAIVDSGLLGHEYSYLNAGTFILSAEDAGEALAGLTRAEEGTRKEAYYEALGEQRSFLRVLRAVSNWGAHGDLARQIDQVQWLDGYDPSCLEGEELVCLLPENLDYQPGEFAPLLLFPTANMDVINSYKIQPRLVELKVVGVYPRNVHYDDRGYCPLRALEAFCLENDWVFTVNSLQFDLKDNRELPQLKQILREQNLGAGGRSAVKAAVDDRILEGTTAPIQSNLDLLEGMYPCFFVVVAVLGFFLCFLLARGRKIEYAIMRMLGESTLQVTLKALVEQAMLCITGVLLGAAVLLILGTGFPDLVSCGFILVCYTVGAAIAVLLLVRVNVMDILRDKE